MLRFHTAGESHGPALVVILEGIPKGLAVPVEAVSRELSRRQHGHGRGGRMKLESDEPIFLGGLRHGVTLGSPLAIEIVNRNHAQQWAEVMSPTPPSREIPEIRMKRLTRPRPGHADLAGALKLGATDMRDVLERASARETAARVAAGAVAKLLLREVGVEVGSHTLALGELGLPLDAYVPWEAILAMESRESPLRCVDEALEARMVALVDEAKAAGETLGGVVEVVAHTPPAGLGSFFQWDLRLDARLGAAILSIPAVKAVEIGIGVEASRRRGSQVHDPIGHEAGRGFVRPSNRAGGLEGGVTNGEELRLRAYKKPISTLRTPLPSVDVVTKEPGPAAYERSDVTAVPAAGVVAEAMTALVLAGALLEKLGGDTMAELTSRHGAHLASLRAI